MWTFRRCGVAVVVVGVVVSALIPAVAQQPAGKIRQAPSIKVAPCPTPEIPEGDTGIARKYPGDIGIENDPNVVFAESFEGSIDEICKRWESVGGKPIMSRSDDVARNSGGKQSLLLTRVAGGTDGYLDGGNLYRRLKNPKGGFGYDQLFFRFTMKFNKEHAPIHHYGSGLVGFNPPTVWAQGRAGLRPDGNSTFTTQIEPGNFTSWNFYSYWHAMGASPPRGQTWGNSFEGNVPARTVAKEKWICLEVMLKMNDIGDTNGEQAYWLDGKLSRTADGKITSYLGKGFPASGVWVYDRFLPYSNDPGIAWDYEKGKGVPLKAGVPFLGFEWRTSPKLNINAMWLYRFMSQPERGTSKVWWDDLVVATKYIGPVSGK